MPYITEEMKKAINPETRKSLDDIIELFPDLNEPELDYVITRISIRQLLHMKPKFVSLNKIWGVMSGAAKEFWDRIVRPYEKVKATDNGDVYAEVLPHFGLESEILSQEQD
jgi:hypothetical protein